MNGNELHRLRLQRGLSLWDLARAIGVTAATVSRWESGDRRIHPAFGQLLTLYFQGRSGESSRKDSTRKGGDGAFRRAGHSIRREGSR